MLIDFDKMATSNPGNSNVSTIVADAASKSAASTDVLTNPSQPFKPNGDARPKVFNSSGVQVIKAGQEIGCGFFDSVVASYTNLVNKPVALFVFVFGLLCLFAEHTGGIGPFGLGGNAALKSANDSTNPYAVRSIASIVAYIMLELHVWGKYIFTPIILGGVYLAKPSVGNAFISGALTAICWVGNFNSIEIAALANLYLLYTQIRAPAYKLSVALFAIVTVILGFAHVAQMVQLSGLKTVTAEPSAPVNPPITDFPPVEELPM